MRVLHTGDWHVGKALRGRSRAEEHRAVLREIAGIAKERDADFVLVAGDLFETSAPSPEAEEIVYRGLLDLAETDAHVIAIAGNHDNPRRLTAIRPLLELTNIHVCPELRRPDDGGILELEARSGGTLRLMLLPFLSQRHMIRADALMGADADKHAATYADRCGRIVTALCANAPADTVNMLVGHAMVHGGVLGGGERSAHTVFEYSVPSTAFPSSLHYVALGHLHRAQTIPGPCPIHFCGSPLQLDFGEEEDRKSVDMIEAEPGAPVEVETVPLSSGRRLRTVRGTLQELQALATDETEDYLRVEVKEQPRPGLADEVRELLPDAVDVRIALQGDQNGEVARRERSGRSPQELFTEYLKDRGEDDESLRALFAELLEEVDATAAS